MIYARQSMDCVRHRQGDLIDELLKVAVFLGGFLKVTMQRFDRKK